MRPPAFHLAAVTVALALALNACSLAGGSGGGGSDAGGGTPPDGWVQQGRLGQLGPGTESFRAEVEVDSVQRWSDRTTVELTIRSLEDEPVEMRSPQGVFGGSAELDPQSNDLHLIDPLRGHLYSQLVEDGIAPLGSVIPVDHVWEPGIEYKAAYFYPELPETTDIVTLALPGSIGEFAGLPVTDGEATAFPDESAAGEGDSVWLPVTDLSSKDAEPAASRTDLYGITEEVVQGRDQDDGRETVALRTDVLFGFDDAALDAAAESVLDDVIAETEERADPEKPPITITGHTDGVGEDDYNQELSEERADAVRDVVEESLGAGYEYEVAGEGAAHPVEEEGGDDDAWARAQNRRVEISYAYNQAADPGPASTPSAEAETSRPEPGTAPGSFHGRAGLEPVASGQGRMAEDYPVDIEVYPFYRDGAFLVARFAMTHRGPRIGELASADPEEILKGGLSGFEEFSVVDPATGTAYREARVFAGDKDLLQGVSSRGWPATGVPGTAHHAYMYVAAPPEDVTSVTFNAGPLGTFTDIPID